MNTMNLDFAELKTFVEPQYLQPWIAIAWSVLRDLSGEDEQLGHFGDAAHSESMNSID